MPIQAAWKHLRLGDVATFLAVRRCGTVSGAARELGTSAPQVSKTVARLEAQLGLRLLVRRADGVAVSEQGRRMLPVLEEIVARVKGLGREPDGAREITAAAPAPLSELLLPLLALPEVRLRSLELSPAAIRAYAGRGLFDVGVTWGEPGGFPASWLLCELGSLRQALFGAPEIAGRLGPPPVPEASLRPMPFVQPGSCLNGEFLDDEDPCPLPAPERKILHSAANQTLAFALAAKTGSLVFGCELAARSYLARGLLAEIPVAGWDVRTTVFLACNQDRMRACDRTRFRAILEPTLRV